MNSVWARRINNLPQRIKEEGLGGYAGHVVRYVGRRLGEELAEILPMSLSNRAWRISSRPYAAISSAFIATIPIGIGRAPT
jgi:hypothetical protein